MIQLLQCFISHLIIALLIFKPPPPAITTSTLGQWQCVSKIEWFHLWPLSEERLLQIWRCLAKYFLSYFTNRRFHKRKTISTKKPRRNSGKTAHNHIPLCAIQFPCTDTRPAYVQIPLFNFSFPLDRFSPTSCHWAKILTNPSPQSHPSSKAIFLLISLLQYQGDFVYRHFHKDTKAKRFSQWKTKKTAGTRGNLTRPQNCNDASIHGFSSDILPPPSGDKL